MEATRSNDAYAWTQAANVNRSYSVNGLNQYSAVGTVVPTYNPRGNMTYAGGQTYQYNTRDQLWTSNAVQLVYRGPSGAIGQIIYNGVTTNFDSIGDALATEFNGSSGAVLRRYVHGAGVDEPLVWYEGSGTGDRRWLHADERGSIIAVTNASGTATAVNSYDEHGMPAAGNIGRFQYTGQKWVAELGLYDYKARMYAPALGRFMQPDPTGYADGMNWYDYVGGDPVNFVDPSGLQTLPDGATTPVLGCQGAQILLCYNRYNLDSLTSYNRGTFDFFPSTGYLEPPITVVAEPKPTPGAAPQNRCPNKGLISLGDNISRFGDATAKAGTILTATAIVADVLAAPTVVGEVPTLTATAVGLGVTAFGGGISLLGKGVSYLGDRNLPRLLASSAGSLGDLLTRGTPGQKLFKQALLDKASDSAGNALSGGCK